MEEIIEITEIRDGRQKREIAREILEALPDWFGIPEARETYIADSQCQTFFCGLSGGDS